MQGKQCTHSSLCPTIQQPPSSRLNEGAQGGTTAT